MNTFSFTRNALTTAKRHKSQMTPAQLLDSRLSKAKAHIAYVQMLSKVEAGNSTTIAMINQAIIDLQLAVIELKRIS